MLRSANLPRRAQNHYRGGVRVANWVEEEYGDHLAGREGALVRAPPDLRASGGGFAGAERGGRAARGDGALLARAVSRNSPSRDRPCFACSRRWRGRRSRRRPSRSRRRGRT